MAVTIKLKKDEIGRMECVLAKNKYEDIKSAMARLGCDILINAPIYDMDGRTIRSQFCIFGKKYGDYASCGLAMWQDGRNAWCYNNNVKADCFCGSYSSLVADGKIKNGWIDKNKNGRTAFGIMADGTIVFHVAAKDSADMLTTAELAQKMLALGCVQAGNLDGSYSSQVISPQGNIIMSRCVEGYIAIWLKKESTEGNKMKSIYLSPSTQENNIGKGDYGTEEFRMNEICDLLENELRGKYILYRNRASMTLQQVVTDSNAKMADIHVAIHSNATGKDGGARGCETYICAGGGQAEKLANCINAEMGKITADRGVKVNSALYETKKTKCPAIICEVDYHDDLGGAEWIIANKKAIAKALANGIMTFFGDKIQQAENWYDADIAWAKENGIMDGTRPNDPVTRAECVAMIHRAVK